MSLAVKADFALGFALSALKNAPGERCIWLTTTRSVPLMMKVPFSVIRGISPRYTFCSITLPTRRSFVCSSRSYTVRRSITRRGATYVIPLWRHSSASCFWRQNTSTPSSSFTPGPPRPAYSSPWDSQTPISYPRYSSVTFSAASETGKTPRNTPSSPSSGRRSAGEISHWRNLS